MTYQITKTREFFGPRKETTVLANYFGEPETFQTREAAESRIAELDAEPYTTAHNESTRPDYKIKRMARA